MKYFFTKTDIKRCEDFANKIDTSFYETRKQINIEKRILDSKIGKLGELAVFNTLCFKYKIEEPDFKIYSVKEKSWDYDLKSNNFNLHVKTQLVDQAIKYGESWVFEKSDKHIFVNKKYNDYVAFVLIDLKNKQANIKAILNVNKIHEENLFKPMKLIHLSSKCAVYFNDLEKMQLNKIIL
jgi:hypothetical protein